MTPELNDQLTDLFERGIQKAIAGHQAEMAAAFDEVIQAHQAGYRDSSLWRRAQLDRDQQWLAAIIRRQASERYKGPRWRLLQDLACAMVPGKAPTPTTPQETTYD